MELSYHPSLPEFCSSFASTVNRLVFPCKWWGLNIRIPGHLFETCTSHLRHYIVVLFVVILSFVQMFGIYNMLLNIAPGERERDQSILCRKKKVSLRKALDLCNIWAVSQFLVIYHCKSERSVSALKIEKSLFWVLMWLP